MTLRRPQSLLPALAVLAFGVLFVDATFVVTVLSHLLRGAHLSDWISFYTGGTLVRTGNAGHLYDASAQAVIQRQLFGAGAKMMGYPLPVFVAFLFAPLTRLSFVASYLVWLAINLALLGVLLRLSWRWLERVPHTLRAIFLVCAVSATALKVVMQGQVDLFVLVGLTGGYALLRADRPFTAGSVLALALFKPHLVAAVVLLLLLKRQWRALVGFAVVGGLLLIVPPLAVAPHLVVDQVRPLVAFNGATTGYGLDAPLMINIRGTVGSLTGSSNVWLWLPLLALIAAVAFYVAIRIWMSRPALHPQSWALAFTLPLLYSPHVHAQSLVLLIAAAGLYLVDSQSSDRPIVDIKYVLAGLVAITMLWWLSLFGLALMAFLVMAAYALFSRRWPEPAAEAARAPQQVELALAS